MLAAGLVAALAEALVALLAALAARLAVVLAALAFDHHVKLTVGEFLSIKSEERETGWRSQESSNAAALGSDWVTRPSRSLLKPDLKTGG